MHQFIKSGSLVLVALVLAIPRRAEAQSAPSWYSSWSCPSSQPQFERCKSAMGVTSGTKGPFTSSPACESWSAVQPVEYRCYSLGGSVSTDGGRGTSPDNPARTMRVGGAGWGLTNLIAQGAVLGGFFGGAAGYFIKHADGRHDQSGPGALIGSAIFDARYGLKYSHQLGWTRTVLAGAAAGAQVGAAVGLNADRRILNGSPADLATKNKTGPYAQIGAISGALAFAALRGTGVGRSGMRSLQVLGALWRPDVRVSLLQRRGYIGTLVRW